MTNGIKTGVVHTEKVSGLWMVVVEGWDFIIIKQYPFHAVLKIGLHENKRAIVEILNNKYAEFQGFV